MGEQQKAKLMLVDDEVIITNQLEEFLNSMGYEVVAVASSGEEAVQLAKSHRPDLILMDIMMPGKDRMDGITAAGEIRKECDIPVIFITAYGGEKIIDRAKNVDPYGFVVKPFQEHELKATIEFALYRMKLERQLRESEQKYRFVIDTATEAILTIDGQSNIAFCNQAVEDLFGYPNEEIAGKPFSFIVPERLRLDFENEINRFILTGESEIIGKTIESFGWHKNGSEFPMEYTLTTWEIKEDVFFTIIARDITERKRIEQMKSDFVSLVSHQLKTPIAAVMGCIDNMLAGLTGDLTDKQLEYLHAMEEINQRNYRIISDLLNISRIERGIISVEIAEVNLGEMLQDAAKPFEQNAIDRDLELIVDIPENPIFVSADHDKYIEALSNIIHNALKFTDKGSIHISTQTQNGSAIVQVKDTGSGIMKQNIQKLFTKDQIFTGAPSSKGGCGLGLYIAKEFMKLMEGDITVSSKFNQGSTFCFSLPLGEKSKKK
ncbi:response regulator [candidate division KSB1 bacterium]|nr:response regulator [candidate division KSB1 bacterium]